MSWINMYILSLRHAYACLLDAISFACDRRIGHTHHMYNLCLEMIKQPIGRDWLDYNGKRYDAKTIR